MDADVILLTKEVCSASGFSKARRQDARARKGAHPMSEL
jgi:hypothetical protein